MRESSLMFSLFIYNSSVSRLNFQKNERDSSALLFHRKAATCLAEFSELFLCFLLDSIMSFVHFCGVEQLNRMLMLPRSPNTREEGVRMRRVLNNLLILFIIGHHPA